MSRFLGVLAGLALFCAAIFLMAQNGGGFKRPLASSQVQATRVCMDNLDVLLSDIAQNDFTRTEQISNDGRSISVQSVERSEETGETVFVDYLCDARPFGLDTAIWGFYYSADDDMTRIWCAGEPLVPFQNGYTYHQPDGDDCYYTEPITDHFFYYEAHY